MINALLVLTFFNPILFVVFAVVLYFFFEQDLASFASRKLKNYINL